MRMFAKCLAVCATAAIPLVSQSAMALPSGAFSQIIVDDGWTFEIVACGSTAAGGGSASCGDVTVTALAGSDIGIDIQLANFSVTGVGAADVAVQYNVTAPGTIGKAFLTQESTIDSMSGDIVASIVEDLDNGVGADDKMETIDAFFAGMPSVIKMDMTDLDAATNSLIVTKDINITSFGGSGSISRVTQSFLAVPEPGTAAMLAGLAIVGAGALRRR